MIHRCICSGYSLKAPPPTGTNPGQRPHPTRLLPPRGPGLAVGREELAAAGWPGGRWRAEQSAIAPRAAEFSHLCVTRAAGGEDVNAGRLLIDPEAVLAGHGRSQAGKVCYHSFFFSSMETPPGPRATTSSKPPITDMVWKKSYLRKSCMGL